MMDNTNVVLASLTDDQLKVLREESVIDEHNNINMFMDDNLLVDLERNNIITLNVCQINPHLPKDECDRLVRENLIFGCGRPFILNLQNGTYVACKCDYI